MNCRDRQHDIILFLYEELSDEARMELRAHLDECGTCQVFLQHEKELQLELTEDFSEWEVPSDLLVDCRRELSEGLDRIDQRRTWWRLPVLSGAVPRMRLLESAALLSVGLAVGVFMTNQLETPTLVVEPAQAGIPQNASVTNLRIIESDSSTGEVELAGDVVQPMRLRGSIEDETVQRLLVGALQSPSNAGVRLGAVELLSQNPRDPDIKAVLMGVLINDDNPGVRLGALQALQAFAQEDAVRQVLKYVIQTDDTPGIRVQALEAMAPMSPDEAIEALVDEVIREDPNPYIRTLELQYVGGN